MNAPGPGGALLRALLLKALFVVVVVAAARAVPADSPYLAPRVGNANEVVWYLARGFDADSYQRMATEGWYDDFSRSHPLGFPALVRGALWLTGNRQSAAVLAANLAGLLATLALLALLRRYAARLDGPVHVDLALLLACATPGLLAFGTLAYSESSMILFAALAWVAFLRAERPAPTVAPEAGVAGEAADARTPAAPDLERAPRHLGWLLGASWLGFVALQMRDLAAPLFGAWGLLELLRVVRARSGRALLEAAALLSGGLAGAALFAWRGAEHGFAELQAERWSVRFEPFAAPVSLARSVSPEFVVLIYASLPVALLLLARTWRVDRRLTLVAALGLFLALSVTGVGAQSFTRYVWALWPLPLGALALRDRGVLWALTGWLVAVSLWCGLGNALGSAAL